MLFIILFIAYPYWKMASEKTLGSTSENHNVGYFTFPVSYNSEELFSSIQ